MSKSSAGVNLWDPGQVRKGFDLSRERMSSLLQVSSKTYERWEKGVATPAEAQKWKLARLSEILALGSLVYTPEGLREFLQTPMPAFDGNCALEMLRRGEFERVLAALAADYEGLGY
ncbi:transcriptional regulator [Gloeobacter violaceus]|uniref:transcriptional regulator n=1 Tax=Gloeobacter violaceus TaxID=33072 RepID=UPI00030E9231|nr:transcriptional regulator [Gloeobacter violaceus]